MGLYVSTNDVAIRLQSKVRFTDDITDENKMHYSLLNRLIEEAEGNVERDLSPRYLAPFQTDDGCAFNQLPARPTRNIIRTLCEIQSVLLVLATDFGKGSAIRGDSYASALSDRYKLMIDKELERKSGKNDDPTGWRFPPLPGLKLNYFNTQADDGYMGMALNTTQGVGGYPAAQINDPRENYTNGTFDPLDVGNGGVFE